jgi:hypothetical protein
VVYRSNSPSSTITEVTILRQRRTRATQRLIPWSSASHVSRLVEPGCNPLVLISDLAQPSSPLFSRSLSKLQELHGGLESVEARDDRLVRLDLVVVIERELPHIHAVRHISVI